MDKNIIINLNLFALEQQIYLDDEFITKSTMKDLPLKIIDICNDKNIYSVNIIGQKQYGEIIAERISIEEKIKYSKNKIKVEVL